MIKEKTSNWLCVSVSFNFTLPLLVEDALTLIKRFLVPMTHTLESITQMRIRFLILPLEHPRIKVQCISFFNAMRVDQAAQALSKLEAKL